MWAVGLQLGWSSTPLSPICLYAALANQAPGASSSMPHPSCLPQGLCTYHSLCLASAPFLPGLVNSCFPQVMDYVLLLWETLPGQTPEEDRCHNTHLLSVPPDLLHTCVPVFLFGWHVSPTGHYVQGAQDSVCARCCIPEPVSRSTEQTAGSQLHRRLLEEAVDAGHLAFAV